MAEVQTALQAIQAERSTSLQGPLRHPRAARTTAGQTREARTHAALTPAGPTPAATEAAGKSRPGEPTRFARPEKPKIYAPLHILVSSDCH